MRKPDAEWDNAQHRPGHDGERHGHAEQKEIILVL